jgi:hypothetical protein
MLPQNTLGRAANALEQELNQEASGRIAYETPIGADLFVVKSGPIPEGHERLTRDAVRGIRGITASDLAVLTTGVRRPDTEKLTNHVNPAQQRRHALRRDLCQPLSAALSDMRNQLVLLHANALRASTRRSRSLAMGWIGEALHLIQDSYAPAHVERITAGGGRHPIVYIRYYGFIGQGSPREHAFPFDTRDLVASGGTLRRWARVAVAASREFLQMMMRHLATPRAPGNAAELRRYMNRHLILSSRRIEPASIYPIKCRIAPRLPIRL